MKTGSFKIVYNSKTMFTAEEISLNTERGTNQENEFVLIKKWFDNLYEKLKSLGRGAGYAISN
ncbi:hypothetical protein [Aquimarina sp. LLG6339-5]|uniref:hypothetical protein n=1 Tax=Aquimarina sp. LLG6339-5 TaxID=3160830 RepID=UPI00386A05AD